MGTGFKWFLGISAGLAGLGGLLLTVGAVRGLMAKKAA